MSSMVSLLRWHEPMLMRMRSRSEEHTSELQSHVKLVCRLLLEKKKDAHHLAENGSNTGNICLARQCSGIGTHDRTRRCFREVRRDPAGAASGPHHNLQSTADNCDILSFPTRRSSDLPRSDSLRGLSCRCHRW